MAIISCCVDTYCLYASLLLFIYVAYKLFKFATADADLNLLGHSLKPGFFKDKIVWVTGASSGIGEELCRQLSSLGASVILSARSKDKLESVRQSLSHPEKSKVLQLDLADRESVATASGDAKELFGRIDILVNNGGVSSRSSFLDFEESSARQLMETNFFGTISLSREVIKIMLDQGGGQIINVSSLAGKFGFALRHYYSASKFALIGLMDSLRYELINKNIQIVNICPGPVKTNVSFNALTGDGTKFGKTDKLIAGGMSATRCAELTLIAACNNVREAWISRHPPLLAAYFAQYCPSIFYFVMSKRALEIQKDVSESYKKKE